MCFWVVSFSFVVGFKLVRFLVERVPMKMAKNGHFYFCSTPLRLGEPEAEFSKFSDPSRCRNSCLGGPLRLGVTLLRLG